MADPTRDNAKEYPEQAPAPPAEVWSDRERALLTTPTGYTHEQLVAIWAGGGKDKGLTTRNAFAGRYGQHLGPNGYVVGAFEPERKDFLGKVGRPLAWVTPSGDRRPKYGDVSVELPRYSRVGVSLDFAGDAWDTAESGQGVVGRRDKSMRCSRTFDASKIAGWVDIEVLCEPDPPPPPAWLVGRWQVTWRNQLHYYHLAPDRTARWARVPPPPVTLPPLAHSAPRGGSFAFGSPSGVTIRWLDSGSVEAFARGLGAAGGDMTGTWNSSDRVEALTARLGQARPSPLRCHRVASAATRPWGTSPRPSACGRVTRTTALNMSPFPLGKIRKPKRSR